MSIKLDRHRVRSIRTKEQQNDFIQWLSLQVDSMPRGIPNMRASDWIEQNIIIVEGDYQGPYSFKMTPYLQEVADRMSLRSLTQEIAAIKANQLGFTMLSLALMCYYIYYGVGPMLFVSGDETMAEETFEKRLDPVMEASGVRQFIQPMIKKTKGGSKATGDTKGSKAYKGTWMRSAGPNSEGKLRNFPAKINIVEEIDVFPQQLKGKGNPVEKIVRRSDGFGVSRRIYYNSTPKEKATSQIAPLFEQGTMSRYTWVCPECGYRQPFILAGFEWEKDDHGAPLIDMDDNGIVRRDPVFYRCQNPAGCDRTIREHEKYKLLLTRRQGGTAEYTASKKPDRPGLWSIQVPAFYSPTRSWLDIILQYWRVKDDPLLWPDFVNDVCAEASESIIATPQPHRLMARRETWRTDDKHIPVDVSFLVLTCDVQGDRLEASLVGWGQDVQSWVLRYWTFEGDTANSESVCWINLANVLEADYERADGFTMHPVVTFVDAGYHTNEARQFCAQYQWRNGSVNGVYPIFGRDENIARGKSYKVEPSDYGAPSIIVNDQHFKKAVYYYLGVESANEKGYIHFPADFSERYFEGLTSEVMTEETDKRTGKRRAKITNTKKKRNEPLDLMKMAYGALYYMCGEYYASVNRRQRAAKKQEVTVDLCAFIRMMDDGTRGAE